LSIKFSVTTIAPEDFLGAARTIPIGNVNTCNWLSDWVPSKTYLEWARRGLSETDAYGLNNALAYAKRAAAGRIDILLQYNHLIAFNRSTYPAKIDALRSVGISIPEVVYELVIDPRNEMEHAYRNPSEESARHAVGTAELFVNATDAEYTRSSIVSVAWNAMGRHEINSSGEAVTFREFAPAPMLFIDIFDEPHAAKIVDPKSSEIRLTSLFSFSQDQAIELANLLRSNYNEASRSNSTHGPMYYREMKRQGAF